MKILILCTGNSCRSQMAQGFLQSLDDRLEVYSAGTKPAGSVNPHALKVMQEIGIDISHHTSDSVDLYRDDSWDFVITVCDNARATCPHFTGQVAKQLHIGFDDPYDATGTEEFILNEYRRVRDEIRSEFREFYHERIQNMHVNKQ
ncbi:MAG: arsenate reductase ArsC [Bacteroidales bacterium]|nr:arsenate reductase ArsC [Bacteroidales bacterium]